MDIREVVSALLSFKASVDKFSAAVDKLGAMPVERDTSVLGEVEGATNMSTKPEHGVTLTEVEDAIIQVKNKRGSSPANQILKKIAGTTSLKKVGEEFYQQIIEACDAALKAVDEPAPAEEYGVAEPKQEAVEPETQEPQAAESGPTLSRADMEVALKAAAKTSDETFDRIKNLIKTVGGAPNMRMLSDDGLTAVYNAFTAGEEDEL